MTSSSLRGGKHVQGVIFAVLPLQWSFHIKEKSELRGLMKRFLGAFVAVVATALNAHAVTFDFESVTGLTALNTNVQGTSLPANSSIVAEVPGLVISSLGVSKDVDINGDGTNDSMFNGVSFLNFTGTGSTAHSGSNVIAGANFDPGDMSLRVVDFNNFVEFRVLNPGTKFFQIWLEVLPGASVQVIFRDEINGGGADLKTSNVTTSGLVNFLSPGADIRNVVFIPVGGGIWLDDLTIAATDQTGGGGGGSTVPEPSSVVLLVSGVAALAFVRKKKHV